MMHGRMMQYMLMVIEGTILKGCPRKTYSNCVRSDRLSFGLSCVDCQDKNDWRFRIKGLSG